MATPRAPFALGVLAADQLPLDEELPVEPVELADVDVQPARCDACSLATCVAQRASRSRCGRLGVARLMNGKVGQVAGQADAAADDDVRLRAGAAQPFAARAC